MGGIGNRRPEKLFKIVVVKSKTNDNFIRHCAGPRTNLMRRRKENPLIYRKHTVVTQTIVTSVAMFPGCMAFEKEINHEPSKQCFIT
jgi:hypothetical protein